MGEGSRRGVTVMPGPSPPAIASRAMAELRRGVLPARRSPYDAEIWRLALPAFGALAAEPLYVLVDTAIVGQLGTRQLAGLAIAGTVLTAAFAVFNFLAYSTTAAVARQIGAANRRAAAALGVDGAWLAGALGHRTRTGRVARIVLDRRRDGRLRRRPPLRARVPAHQPHRRALHAADARRDGLPARHPGHANDARDRGRGQRREPRARGAVRVRLPLGHRRLRHAAPCSRR